MAGADRQTLARSMPILALRDSTDEEPDEPGPGRQGEAGPLPRADHRPLLLWLPNCVYGAAAG